MENDTLTELVKGKLETLIAGSSLFIVDVAVKPVNNIKIYLDGDNGINIEAISNINRSLYKLIEESGRFPEGDFSLEVSSPGVDEPLKFYRQYPKNIGRKAAVTLNDDSTLTGTLKSVTEEKLTLSVQIGKKKETQEKEIPFAEIKKTVVQITF
ncbi:MAG: ribosome maturation factor [Edaphocola sp.]